MKKLILLFCVSILTISMFYACKENTFQDGTLSPYITIYDVKKLFKGNDVTLTSNNLGGAKAIRGLVVANTQSDNGIDGSLVIQGYKLGNLRGIILDFKSQVDHINIGDSIAVDIINATLKTHNGSIIITNLNADNIVKLKTGIDVQPTLLSSSQLIAAGKDYESTLVKVLSNNLVGNFDPNVRYGGNHVFNDGTSNLTIYALADGNLADKRVAASASFTGVASFYYDPAETGDFSAVRLWPRNYDDVTDESGPMYAKFPETFETITKTTTTREILTLPSGSWIFYEARAGTSVCCDRMNPAGVKSVRFSKDLAVDAYLQMNFDVAEGAKKVTFLYGATDKDDPSMFRLEYSIDGGISFLPIGDDVYVDQRVATLATYNIDISVPVRFRINKIGLGPSTISIKNGRLNIDDFAIYTRIN